MLVISYLTLSRLLSLLKMLWYIVQVNMHNLLYALEVCNLSKRYLQSLDVTVNRFFLWNCFEQVMCMWLPIVNAGVSTGIAVTASFSQQTEDRAFCPVVQLYRASHCTDYHVTSLLFLRVTCPCSLRTYATLKFIRSSSSSSPSCGST